MAIELPVLATVLMKMATHSLKVTTNPTMTIFNVMQARILHMLIIMSKIADEPVTSTVMQKKDT